MSNYSNGYSNWVRSVSIVWCMPSHMTGCGGAFWVLYEFHLAICIPPCSAVVYSPCWHLHYVFAARVSSAGCCTRGPLDLFAVNLFWHLPTFQSCLQLERLNITMSMACRRQTRCAEVDLSGQKGSAYYDIYSHRGAIHYFMPSMQRKVKCTLAGYPFCE